jgi:hypothetical protein
MGAYTAMFAAGFLFYGLRRFDGPLAVWDGLMPSLPAVE